MHLHETFHFQLRFCKHLWAFRTTRVQHTTRIIGSLNEVHLSGEKAAPWKHYTKMLDASLRKRVELTQEASLPSSLPSSLLSSSTKRNRNGQPKKNTQTFVKALLS